MFILQSAAFSQETLKESVEIAAPSMSELTVYSEDEKFGIKDKGGNIIVPAEYKKLIRVGTSSWIVQKKNKFGLIDNSGKILVKPKYRHVERVFGKFVKLGNENDYALYDEKGEIILAHRYSKIDILFGGMFLTCRNFKYGVTDSKGNVILENMFDDIYMPKPNIMRIQYNGELYEIEHLASEALELPEDITTVKTNKEFKVTNIIADTGVISGYSVLTATDYFIKLFSSISPAHEETIDELMFSQGAETVSIFIKLSWLPKYPYTYVKKYINNIRTPNNGPLVDVRNELKQKINN